MMSDELLFKPRESPATEDDRRQMAAAMASAFTARATFGAELCAAIEQAAHIGEAARLAHMSALALFAPTVESLRLMAQAFAALRVSPDVCESVARMYASADEFARGLSRQVEQSAAAAAAQLGAYEAAVSHFAAFACEALRQAEQTRRMVGAVPEEERRAIEDALPGDVDVTAPGAM
jgi:hypothetical protein